MGDREAEEAYHREDVIATDQAMHAEPIRHPAGDGADEEWWECPVCGEELIYSEGGDRYYEGYAPQAVPDQWRCPTPRCGYEYAS